MSTRTAVQEEVKRLGGIHYRVKEDTAGNKFAGYKDPLRRFVTIAQSQDWAGLLTAVRAKLGDEQ